MVEPKIRFQTVKDHNLTDQELEKAKKFIQEKNPPKKEKIVEMTTAKEEKIVEMTTAKETVEVQESAPVESKKKSKKKK